MTFVDCLTVALILVFGGWAIISGIETARQDWRCTRKEREE
jgi:hypothetical protein